MAVVTSDRRSGLVIKCFVLIGLDGGGWQENGPQSCAVIGRRGDPGGDLRGVQICK